jgi:hypothetical protein
VWWWFVGLVREKDFWEIGGARKEISAKRRIVACKKSHAIQRKSMEHRNPFCRRIQNSDSDRIEEAASATID